jgi:prevent-host-death family protein
MKHLRADAVFSVTDLKASPSKIIRLATEEGPVVITVEGKAVAVVLTPAEYDELYMGAGLAKSLLDSREGRTSSQDEVERRMAERRAKRAQLPQPAVSKKSVAK